MSLLEKAFNSLAAALKLVGRVEPVPKNALTEERVRRQQLDETSGYPIMKTMMRSDAKERVRIVQKGSDFGAVVDFDNPRCGWSPEHIVAGGFIYESPAAAEAEARAALRWLKELSEDRASKILQERCGRWTVVELTEKRIFRVFDIAWGRDIGDEFDHIITNSSPGPKEAHSIDFFFTSDVVRITDPETNAVLFPEPPARDSLA